MLKIEGLTKTYGSKKAVDHLSLHIHPGEIYGFIGHNGAGKTTTIKCCCGILNFEEGEILIDGKSIRSQPLACKKELAYIPDNPDLYEFMSGIKYLNFIADIYGVPGMEREERIHRYARQFELMLSLIHIYFRFLMNFENFAYRECFRMFPGRSLWPWKLFTGKKRRKTVVVLQFPVWQRS